MVNDEFRGGCLKGNRLVLVYSASMCLPSGSICSVPMSGLYACIHQCFVVVVVALNRLAFLRRNKFFC